MFKAIKEFFMGKPVAVAAEPVAPYKVEPPVVAAPRPTPAKSKQPPRTNGSSKKIATARKSSAPRRPKAPTV